MASEHDTDTFEQEEHAPGQAAPARRRERFNNEYDVVLLRAVVAHPPFAVQRGNVAGEWGRVAARVNSSLGKNFTARACRDRATILRTWEETRGSRLRALGPGGVKDVVLQKLTLLQQIKQLRAAAREEKRQRNARRPYQSDSSVLNVLSGVHEDSAPPVAAETPRDAQRGEGQTHEAVGEPVEAPEPSRKRQRADQELPQSRMISPSEEIQLRREELQLRREELQEQRAAREQQVSLLQLQLQQSREQMQQSAAHTDALIRLLTAALDRSS